MLLVQDIEQDSQTTLERKTLRRAFYSREAKNLIDDDDDNGKRNPAGGSFWVCSLHVWNFASGQRERRRRRRMTTCPPPRSEGRRSRGG